jgi:hypothetical protein
MRAYPNRGLIGVVLSSAIALAACGGSAATNPPDGGAGSATPAANSTDAATTPASQGGGTGNVPALTAGDWTAGKAHAEVSGDVSGTFDAPLLVGLATTDGPATQLTYVDAATNTQIAVAINGSDVSISVGNGEWVGGAGTSGSPCTVQFTKGDASNVAGTVSCPDAVVIDSTGTGRSADMTVTFEATR